MRRGREDGAGGRPSGRLAVSGFRLAVFALVLSSAAWASGALAGRAWWWAELLTHFRALHAILTLLVVCAFFLLRRWRWGCVAAVVCAVLSLPLVRYYRPVPQDEGALQTAAASGVKAVLLNLNRRNRDTVAVETFLRGEMADLVVLLEVTPEWVAALTSWAERYAHQVCEPREEPFGIWVLSVLPMVDAEVIMAPSGVPAVRSEIGSGGGRFSLLAMHPVPPVGAAAAAARNADLRWASLLAGQAAGAFVLLGDLNLSPFSPHFRDLLRNGGLCDVVDQLGGGVRNTWFPGIPGVGLPLDHCLVSEGRARGQSHRVGPPVGSDHRPVVVTFFIADAPGG